MFWNVNCIFLKLPIFYKLFRKLQRWFPLLDLIKIKVTRVSIGLVFMVLIADADKEKKSIKFSP